MASLYFAYEGELLHQAAIYDAASEFLKDLLTEQANGDVNCRDPHGQTPTHVAAQHGSERNLKLLLESGGNPNLVSFESDKCSTAAHHAARNGHLACLHLLVEHGADLDIQNSDKKTPIDLALEQSFPSCVHFLNEISEKRRLEKEAQLETELYDELANGNYKKARNILIRLGDKYNVNKEYKGGCTLLYTACEVEDVETVQLLIEKGAQSISNVYKSITPLYVSCLKGNVEISKILVKNFPESAKQGTRMEKNNPLHIVSSSGNLEILRILLQTEDGSERFPCVGLDINCVTTSGMTALHKATLAGHIEIVEQLLDPCHKCVAPCKMNGVINVNAKSNVGRTPLHDAVTLGHVNIARLLLEHNADPNCVVRTDESNNLDGLRDEFADIVDVTKIIAVTPLELACYQKHVEMVKILLKYGANDLGSKCLQHVIANNDQAMTDLLLGKGVHVCDEFQLPAKLRDERNDLAPIAIVWHNHGLNNLKFDWIAHAPQSILRPAVIVDMSTADITSTITKLDLSKNYLETIPIELFQLTSLKYLNISHNAISILPGPHKRTSYHSMCDDVVDESNEAIWYSPQLEEIEIQSNNLTCLPSCIFLLPSLKTLNASNNDIQRLPFEMWNTPSLKTVILSNNFIKNLPLLPNGSDVYSSHVAGNRRSKRASSEYRDESSRNATSSGRYVPEDLKEVKSERLRMTSFRSLWNDGSEENEDSDDEDEDIRGQIECSLEKIDISFNQLTSFPVGLPCLTPKLSRLLLSNNNIEKFPPIQEIPENLSLLDLSYNKLRHCLPPDADMRIDRLCHSPVIKQRKTITKKPRQRSKTSGSMPLPRSCCRHCRHHQLRNLKRLELNHNELTQVRFISTIVSVKRTTSLSNVNIKEENSPSGQCLYPNLVSLTLNDNQLEYFTEELGQLTKLGSLNLSNNPLTKSPRLPPEIGMLGDLWDLNLKGLNLIDPPLNVQEKRTKAITGYLLSVLDKSKPSPFMKLMFVGVSNIGKTTLLSKLREDHVTPPGWHERRDNKKTTVRNRKSNVSTVGVDVSEWIFPNQVGLVFKTKQPSIRFSTWDFGGQNEYYATHQCFLSQRALYLAIWKLTDGEQGVQMLEPWLLNIQARAPDSVVIIVGTFYDCLTPSKKKSGFVEAMHKLILKRYVGVDYDGSVNCPRDRGLPKVVSIVDVSCTSGYNIDKLRHAIYKAAMDIKGPGKHSLLGEQLIPASYLAVETAVKNVTSQCYDAKQTPVLEAEQFREKVENELEIANVKLRDREELEQACQFLHDNGVLLHYDDPSLSGLYFLDPQWLCDMLAHVVTIRDVNPLVQNGVMKYSDLSQLFRSSRFPSHLIRGYLDLLNKFEVALPWSTEHLLIPSLLPEDQMNSPRALAPGVTSVVAKSMNMAAYKENRVLRRQYVMSYVPSGFWPRLITRIINDKELKSLVGECMEFVADDKTGAVGSQERAKIAQTEWSCWKTGLELSCFGVKLLRISQLNNIPFYGCPEDDRSYSILMNDEEQLMSSTNVVEIVAPSVVMTMEKFTVKKEAKSDAAGKSHQRQTAKNFIGFRVKSVRDTDMKSASRFLALIVDHVDTLLNDWYPGLDTTNIFGDNLVTRRILCGKCVSRVITGHTTYPQRQSNEEEQDETDKERISPESNASDENRPPSYGAVGNSMFYPMENNHRNEYCGKTDDDVDSPSSDSETSSGLGTDNSNVGQSDKGSLDSHRLSSDRDDQYSRKNGYEDDSDQSRASSQTSGVAASPRHEGCSYSNRITAFEFEECVVQSHKTDYVVCPVDGELDMKELAPDVVFSDIAPTLMIKPEYFSRKKFLGRGSFGTVYAGEIKQGNEIVQVALKMPLDNDVEENASDAEIAAAKAAKRKVDEVPRQIYTDAYRTIRQELSIMINLDHPNVLQLKGFCLNPLSLILEFAPLKSLDKILAKYKRSGKRLDPYVLQDCVVQCSSALRYLHKNHIIYRDLKSENILVWKFPDPFQSSQMGVFVKIADYGISRSATIAKSKGLGGTPGFMAPEIEKYSGREAYTDKVDSFSFGMFMYELITLSQPFADCTSAQIKQYIVEGKRPPLNSKDRRAPVFSLELMFWCWCSNPEERPSSSQIYNVAISSEFPRLMDVLLFDETLSFAKSITVGSRIYTGHGADGQLGVGKEVWLFRGKLTSGVQNESVNVLCYSNGKAEHVEEYAVGKNTIRVACSVGSTVWLASDAGFIYVYCSLTHKQLCQGSLACDKYILSMIHVPKCNYVLVALSNGQVVAYSDHIYNHNTFKEGCDLTSPKDLSPLRTYAGNTSVHCMAALMVCRSSGNDRTAGMSGSREVVYEVWCGKQKGRIAVLNAETLTEDATLSAEDCDIDNPCLDNLTVTKLETCQTFGGTISPEDPSASSVWVAVYPGTSVYRYDATTRKVVNSIDCSQNRPSNEGSHQIYGAGSSRKSTKFQVLSLLVVNRELYIGTSSGCFLVCNSLSLLVYSVVRCHQTSLECLLPLTTTPVTWTLGTEESYHAEHNRLVLTCGKGYRSVCPGRVGNASTSNSVNLPGKNTKSSILVWLADERANK